MFTRISAIAACAALLTLTALTPARAAGNWRHTSYLTFSRSFALPGMTLPAGTYIFERADLSSRTDVVQVLSRDRSRPYLIALTDRTVRPKGLAEDKQIVLGEVPAGVAPPVIAWNPAGEALGHTFRYSK